MKLDFKKYLIESGVAYVSSAWTGSEAPDSYAGRSPYLWGTDATLPNETHTGTVTSVIKNSTPIRVLLSDGYEFPLSRSELDRIEKQNGKPIQRNTTMTITLQKGTNQIVNVVIH